MSNNRIRYEGLEELKAALRNMPEQQRSEGGAIVFRNANMAAGEIRSRYEAHRRSGDLAEKVEVQELRSGGKYFAGAVVRSKSKITSIFENGSELRYTKLGDPRGKMPPAHIFVPIVMKRRRAMLDELKQLLRDQGLKVK